MFDRSLLPKAEFEFVVISDTHFMLDVAADQAVEFPSRRRQTARAERALGLVAALGADFVIHLGDLVQEHPETPRFAEALQAALSQIRAHGLTPHYVAGNHDVGDKPDPTMPTQPVTEESLAFYHAQVGPSWYSFDHHNCHFVVLNSQIMNSAMPEAGWQQEWFQRDLANARGKRLFVFLHLPPYVCHADEPALGHYDNIAEPARGWLLGQLARYEAELLVAGHVHYGFFDRIGKTCYYVMPSPSFTRPGFGHLFSSGPPSEQGRDDTGKLGFYLFRVRTDRTEVHFIRTGGETNPVETSLPRLLTRVSSSLPNSPLGVTLCHPLAESTQVPLAWPSAIRQPVRNDYPLLSLLELGATALRVPWSDLIDPQQRFRLDVLRDEGVKVVATSLWSAHLDLPGLVHHHCDGVDGWEVQIAGSPWPSDECLEAIARCREEQDVPLALCPVIPHEQVQGKQHRRTRWGYRPAELARLDQMLAAARTDVDRVVCRVGSADSPWETVRSHLATAARDGSLDLLVPFFSLDDRENAHRAAEALFAAAMLPGVRVYFEPLIDLDRTMDVTGGLLDTQCNPRVVFHVLRRLNTILFADDQEAPWEPDDAAATPLSLLRGGQRLSLLRAGENGLSEATVPGRLHRLSDSLFLVQSPDSRSQTVETLDPETVNGRPLH